MISSSHRKSTSTQRFLVAQAPHQLQLVVFLFDLWNQIVVPLIHFIGGRAIVAVLESHELWRGLCAVRELLEQVEGVRAVQLLIVHLAKVWQVFGLKNVFGVKLADLVSLQQRDNLLLLVKRVHLPEGLDWASFGHEELG